EAARATAAVLDDVAANNLRYALVTASAAALADEAAKFFVACLICETVEAETAAKREATSVIAFPALDVLDDDAAMAREAAFWIGARMLADEAAKSLPAERAITDVAEDDAGKSLPADLMSARVLADEAGSALSADLISVAVGADAAAKGEAMGV